VPTIRLPDLAVRDARYLGSQERVVMLVPPHWAVLLRAFLEAGGAVVLALGVTIALDTRGSHASVIVTLLWYAALFMNVRLLWRVADWHADHLMITNKRLLRVSGIVLRRVHAMPLSMITDLTYSREPLGRLLGYGQFMVDSAGQARTFSDIKYVASPDRVYVVLLSATFGDAPTPLSD
jgi:hypothetical protein